MGPDPALVTVRKIWQGLKEQLTIGETGATELEKNSCLKEHMLLVKDLDIEQTEKTKTVLASFLLFLGLYYAVISLQDAEQERFSPITGFKAPTRKFITEYGLEPFFDPGVLDHVPERNDAEISSLLAKIPVVLEKHGIDPFGSFIQELMAARTRKRYAANYTVGFILDLLACLAIEQPGGLIMDPFAGSGKLLAAVIKRESEFDSFDKKTILQRLYGVELFKFAVMLTVCQLAFTCYKQGIPVPRDYYKNPLIYWGDSFELLKPKGAKNLKNYFKGSNNVPYFPDRFDLIIQNPPYSRYTNLPKKYTGFLRERFSAYRKCLKHQLGLHGFALLLADEMLAENGRIAAILPASTLYSNYGTGLKQLLLKKYQIEFVITSKLVKAFSEGSDFREIVLICKKMSSGWESRGIVKFISLEKHPKKSELPGVLQSLKEMSSKEGEDAFFTFKYVDQAELDQFGNWMVHFFSSDHEKLVTDFSKRIDLKLGSDMNFQLFRGFEMYGPDFFFVPNKNWIIKQIDTLKITIQEQEGDNSAKKACEIPSEYFPLALRKPALYSGSITPNVEHRVLKVPPGVQNEGVLNYIALNGIRANVARKQFGKNWYSHVHMQFRTKNPIGHVFMVDKFSVASAALIAHFTDESVAASKNFYILKTDELKKDKFYAAWLNSAIFLLLFLYHRREIGGSFGRLQIADYLSKPLFIKYRPDSESIAEILDAFDRLRGIELPPIERQMELPQRRQLDLSFLNYVGIPTNESEIILTELYRVIKNTLATLKVRDSELKKRRRLNSSGS